MGRETFVEVRDGSLDSRGGPGRFVGLSGRFETGRETLGEVRNRLRYPRVIRDGSGVPTGRSRMGRGTLELIRDGSSDSQGGPGRVG